MDAPPTKPCPFCNPDSKSIVFEEDQMIGLWDAFPVSRGHALVVPRRHVADWFAATTDERALLMDGVQRMRDVIGRLHRPDGFNIGVNVAEAAGQTVPHLHVHVIPRFRGDVPDPRGGIRHVIPGKGNYLTATFEVAPVVDPPRRPCSPHFVRGGEDQLLDRLLRDLDNAFALDVAVAFITTGGVSAIDGHLRDLLHRRGRARIVTGDYLGVTEPDALLRLLDLRDDFEGALELFVFETGDKRSYHPKAYILHARDGLGHAYIGSSNLTKIALLEGVEWNYRLITPEDASGFAAVSAAFNDLLRDPAVRPVDWDWVQRYRSRRDRPTVPPLEYADEPADPHPSRTLYRWRRLTLSKRRDEPATLRGWSSSLQDSARRG